MYGRMHACIYVCMQRMYAMYVRNVCMQYMYAMYVCVCTYLHIYTQCFTAFVYMYTYVYVLVHICIYIYICRCGLQLLTAFVCRLESNRV